MPRFSDMAYGRFALPQMEPNTICARSRCPIKSKGVHGSLQHVNG